MAVEVGGGDQGPLRSKWLRGRWVSDRRNSFSISVDNAIAPEEETTFKSSKQPKKPQWSQLEGEVNDGMSSSGGTTAVMTEVTTGTTCTRRYARKSEGADGQHMMIPLYNMVTAAPIPPGANTKQPRKSSERRAKIFQRAYSCDVDRHPEGSVERPSRSCRSQELEMTCVEVDQLGVDVFDASKTTDALLLLESHSSSLEGSTIASGELKDSERDAGIVCSDEDLHSILSEISHSRRLSAEVKREKMKSNRSLSLDSSFFKLHMKRLQADSPTWLARILNQRDRKESSSGGGSSATATMTSECGSDVAGELLLLRKRSVSSKKPESTPATISEDTVSVEGDLSSRRESTVSGSDDECSLLLVNNSDSVVQGNANPIVNVAATDNRTLQASRVVWNESSVVDAEVLGHAIEFYLTSATGKRPSVDACECNCQAGIIANSPGGEACVPVMSSLKSLFV